MSWSVDTIPLQILQANNFEILQQAILLNKVRAVVDIVVKLGPKYCSVSALDLKKWVAESIDSGNLYVSDLFLFQGSGFDTFVLTEYFKNKRTDHLLEIVSMADYFGIDPSVFLELAVEHHNIKCIERLMEMGLDKKILLDTVVKTKTLTIIPDLAAQGLITLDDGQDATNVINVELQSNISTVKMSRGPKRVSSFDEEEDEYVSDENPFEELFQVHHAMNAVNKQRSKASVVKSQRSVTSSSDEEDDSEDEDYVDEDESDDINEEPYEQLLAAIQMDDTAEVKEVLKQVPKSVFKYDDGKLLTEAIANKNFNVVKMLVEAGVNINDDERYSAKEAIYQNSEEIFFYLVSKGLVIGGFLRDILDIADKHKNPKILAYLRGLKKSKSYRDEPEEEYEDEEEDQDYDEDYDYMRLFEAVEHDDIDIVKKELKKMPRSFLQDPVNGKLLVSAVENENLQMVKLLVEAGVSVNDPERYAIREAVFSNNEEIFFYLAGKGLKIGRFIDDVYDLITEETSPKIVKYLKALKKLNH